ncbi:MAG TPA: FtsX-like permease family protein [Oceanipulchritudo sp.]|nr:FtsX-like permease family protein [Oceanipulchritudo sp.]
MLPFSYAARNLLRNPGRFLQKLAGSVLILFLLLAAAAFNEGMERLLQASGSPETVIFLGAGSEESVERSQIPVQTESMVMAGVPGIARRAGVLAVSGEINHMGLIGVGRGKDVQAVMRGIRPAAFEVHREARISEGLFPRMGEVLVGRLAAHSLGIEPEALKPGKRIEVEEESYTVAGVFEAEGTVLESEIWFNRQDLMTLIQRDTLSAVVVRMESAQGYALADLFAKQRLDLELAAVPESTYYANLARFYGPIRGMTWLTAALVGIGAVMGGLNLLYASFAARIRELATLQTLGYGRRAVLVSLIQESLLVQLLGMVLAALAAVILIDGSRVQFSMGTFVMELSPPVILASLAAALLLGLLGPLPPAARSLRMPLPKALRSH